MYSILENGGDCEGEGGGNSGKAGSYGVDKRRMKEETGERGMDKATVNRKKWAAGERAGAPW